MSDPKWTPGPWYVGRNIDTDVYGPKGLLVANCASTFPRQDGELRANTSLIAAAPELYEALEAICDELLNGGEAGAFEAYAIAKHAGRAALAKAADGGEG